MIAQDLEQLRHKYGTTKTKSTNISSYAKNKSVTTHDKDEFLISVNELLKLPENSQIIKYNHYNLNKVQIYQFEKLKFIAKIAVIISIQLILT